MVHELKVPSAGESIQEVQIGQWLKSEGEWVEQDENVVELETDKAAMDLPAPVAGVLKTILRVDGDVVEVGDVIAQIDEAAQPTDATVVDAEPGPLPDPLVIMPAAQRLLREHGLQGRDVEATGPNGRLLKEDVLRHLEEQKVAAEVVDKSAADEVTPVDAPTATTGIIVSNDVRELDLSKTEVGARSEEVVPMTMIRRHISRRLVEAQQNAALLTTFNEVDLTGVKKLREKHRDAFLEKYSVKLGFMSFFTKAVVEVLKQFPALNAEIRGDNVIYRNYFDIGVAIGGGKGLVVPTLRNAERMSFAEVEQKIADFAERSKSNKIRPDELEGGTFTITNGGVYGSLLSTPIVNPPQSGVLGLHSIQDRPVARDGQVVIRPMMYIALTYDHRIVDGREAVTFLKSLKEIIEDPARMLLEI